MAHPSLARVTESGRCGSDKVQGRHPYLVTRAAVLGVWEGVPPTATLHAHTSRGKGDEVHTCTPRCAVRPRSACFGWPVPVESARTIRLMRYREEAM